MFDSEGGFIRLHDDDTISFTGSLPRNLSNSDYKTSVSIWVYIFDFEYSFNLFCLPFKSHFKDSTGTAADRDIECCARVEATGGRKIITFSCYLDASNKFAREINITYGDSQGGWHVYDFSFNAENSLSFEPSDDSDLRVCFMTDATTRSCEDIVNITTTTDPIYTSYHSIGRFTTNGSSYSHFLVGLVYRICFQDQFKTCSNQKRDWMISNYSDAYAVHFKFKDVTQNGFEANQITNRGVDSSGGNTSVYFRKEIMNTNNSIAITNMGWIYNYEADSRMLSDVIEVNYTSQLTIELDLFCYFADCPLLVNPKNGNGGTLYPRFRVDSNKSQIYRPNITDSSDKLKVNEWNRVFFSFAKLNSTHQKVCIFHKRMYAPGSTGTQEETCKP
ncbi:unnamed protein product [Moneuplotes crassus]|uniref:Uncharacterized protein n=1 Tax=Euplotes crassus TaxID=5936 RepID=A0AAD1TYE3_EUPCR|nr:unnamed protein product [Moneuplotes crassus]